MKLEVLSPPPPHYAPCETYDFSQWVKPNTNTRLNLQYDYSQQPDIKHLVENKRAIYPSYFLEMMGIASDLISSATSFDIKYFKKKSIFEQQSRAAFRERTSFLASEIDREFSMDRKGKQHQFYSPFEYLLYEHIWNGEDIWPELDRISSSLIESHKKNPRIFWKSFYELGLEKVFPYFYKNRNPISLDQAKLFIQDDLTLSATFNLIPDLSPYYDRNLGKEQEQSDEYYIKIALAQAKNSWQKGEKEPVTSLFVRDGRIYASATNTNGHNPRHAEIIASDLAFENTGKDVELNGFCVFSVLETCPDCAMNLRRYNLDRVVAGSATAMGSETGYGGMLKDQKVDLAKRGYKRPPREVKIGVLEDEVREFFINIVGWPDMFDGI